MPRVIKSVDEIMNERKRDTYFIQFGSIFDSDKTDPSRQRHFQWFDSKDLSYELAAPRGWLEGNPGIYAVYFDSPSDPRVAEYSARFEDINGKSLDPQSYQMVLLQYQSLPDDPN